MARIVAAAIIDEAGRLLAARRSCGTFAGLWEFPGGKVEAGEDDETALLRELQEELGVTVSVGSQVGGDWPVLPDHTMRVYRVTLAPGNVPQCRDVHDDLRWLAPQEAYSVPWIPADLPIVAATLGVG